MGKIMYIGYSFYEMFFIFLFWSITGWLIEVADMAIEAGELQNRGFLHMPLCPLYGLGMLFMSILLKDERQSYAVLFICGVTVCTAFEYFAGWALEKLFNARWWDYSHMKFNFKGRICLRNTLLFGFGTILVIGFIQPVVEITINKIPVHIGQTVLLIAAPILLIDILASVRRAFRYKIDCTNGETLVIFKSHK